MSNKIKIEKCLLDLLLPRKICLKRGGEGEIVAGRTQDRLVLI